MLKIVRVVSLLFLIIFCIGGIMAVKKSTKAKITHFLTLWIKVSLKRFWI